MPNARHHLAARCVQRRRNPKVAAQVNGGVGRPLGMNDLLYR